MSTNILIKQPIIDSENLLIDGEEVSTKLWVQSQGYVTSAEAGVTFGTTAGTAAEGNDTRIVNQVQNTRKINDKVLDEDVTLTKSDIGLQNVDDTADENKVVKSQGKLTNPVTINGESFDGSQNITINAVDSTPRIAESEKGIANGVATLDQDGKVPTSQLPSYVSDVLEFDDFDDFPEEGERGNIYVDKDTGDIYRWSGSQYIIISDAASSADQATKLATARTIEAADDVVSEIDTDVTWSVSFDGENDVSAPQQLTETGVTSGQYTRVTVDKKGRVTAADNPTTLEDYGLSVQVSSAFDGFLASKDSDNIANGSDVDGQTVSAALDNLDEKIDVAIEDYNSIKAVETKTTNYTVVADDFDKLIRVGDSIQDTVVTLPTAGQEAILVRFKRVGQGEVTFSFDSNPLTDRYGNNAIISNSVITAYWDGSSWSLEGSLKYIG